MIKSGVAFESEEHEKAWLIRTATNVCKNIVKHWFRKRVDLSDYDNLLSTENIEIDDTFEVVMSLPDKYKAVVYLYYYEGYNSVEIAKNLGKPQSTIRNYLHEARKVLRERIGGDLNEE